MGLRRSGPFFSLDVLFELLAGFQIRANEIEFEKKKTSNNFYTITEPSFERNTEILCKSYKK